MKQSLKINIPKRKNTPETVIYAEIYTRPNCDGPRDTLLMVPGGPGNDLSMYNSSDHSITQALLPYIDIILFDPRGCGKSEKSQAKHCTLDEYVDDIEEIRKYFNLSPNQFILFGQSYGSVAATGYAIKYRKNIKKLFLIGAVSSGSFLKEAIDELLIIGTPEQKKYAKIIWDGTFTGSEKEISEYYETMGPLYAYSFKPGGVAPALTYNVDIMNLGFSCFLKEFNYQNNLSKIICPTLILWGEDEWIFSRKQVESVHKKIKNSKLIAYSNCGHMLWLDQWDRFLNDAKDFINT